MPRKRIESKVRQRNDVLARPNAWILFWLGWCYNEDPGHEPYFESIEEMRTYYFENKERVLQSVGMIDCWAYHAFEEHDRSNCDYCKDRGITGFLENDSL